MKILICAGIFPPEIGGPATYSASIARALANRGHEIRVITYGESEKLKVKNEKFRIFCVSRSRFKPWHHLKYYLAAKKYGKTADILYAQDPVSAGYPAMIAARALKKPFVLKITGDYSWEQAQNRALTDLLVDEFQSLKNYPKPVKKIRNIQIQSVKAAHLIITPSEYLKKLAAGWGIDPGKIQVIYNAVSAPEIMSKQAARTALGIAADDFMILSAGRDVVWKGFNLLRQVAEDVRKTHPRIILRILHDADRAEMAKFLSAADIFVLNTGYEGFSHMILETMAAGLPVVTTKVGGNPEIVREGENGLLVEYNNFLQLKEAIIKLFESPDLRLRLSQEARRVFEAFGGRLKFESMIAETESALLKVAGKR